MAPPHAEPLLRRRATSRDYLNVGGINGDQRYVLDEQGIRQTLITLT